MFFDHSYKQLLYRKYDIYEDEQHPERKKLLFMEIKRILQGLHAPDAEDLYIWGLIYYNKDDEDREQNLKIAAEQFMHALDREEHCLGRLYLAHCYHDQKQYSKALENYLKVDEQELKDFQLWRYIKLLEQIGECYYQLGEKKTGEQYFGRVLAYYREMGSDDLATPTEILRCLPPDHPFVAEMKQLCGYLTDE